MEFYIRPICAGGWDSDGKNFCILGIGEMKHLKS